MAQQNSGWNEINRSPDGAFGLFGLSPEQREGLGIGDSADASEQITIADGYWRNLASKWNNDYDMVAAEFKLGPDGIQNPFSLQKFKDGFGAINKKLGEEFKAIAKSLKNDYDELFPGDAFPTEQDAKASEEAKAAVEAAETAEALPSGRGYQSTVGVLVFAKSDAAATPNIEEGAVEVQAEAAAINRDRFVEVTDPELIAKAKARADAFLKRNRPRSAGGTR
jgi:hypothetical protein